MISKHFINFTQPKSASDFLIANRELSSSSVTHLLLSSSFGVNALFYATWLGYTIGAWALLIQAFWALSFILLSQFINKFKSINSLHDLLGKSFGKLTQIAAAICSLVGITYFIGWEVGIGKAGLNSVASSDQLNFNFSFFGLEIAIVLLVIFTLTYTIIAGIRGNASINKIFNYIKILLLLFIVSFCITSMFVKKGYHESLQLMLPDFEVVLTSIGVIGLITNLIFNITWQFVDNSTWQSIVAGSKSNCKSLRKTLLNTSLLVFLTIGLLGTLLGASFRGLEGVSPDNILAFSGAASIGMKFTISIAMLIIICTSIISLIDGMLLASSLTITKDLFINPSAKMSTLRFTQLSLVILSLLSIWGVQYIVSSLGGGLFDFVYILIVSQLALAGPVLIALITTKKIDAPMFIPIFIALFTGFGTIIAGIKFDNPLLIDLAGTISIMTSIIIAMCFYIYSYNKTSI